MFDKNIVLAIVILLQSILLYEIVIQERREMSFKLLISLSLLLISLFQFKNDFYKNIWTLNPTEKVVFYSRHSFLSNDLKFLYNNRIGTYIYTNVWYKFSKYQTNFFYNLDPNQYFFLSHPLERSGIDEFAKFSPFLIPFFIIGVFWFFQSNTNLFFLGYILISLIISGFIDPNSFFGPILFLPIIAIITTKGVLLLPRTVKDSKLAIKQWLNIKK